jgi:hypothetical protein
MSTEKLLRKLVSWHRKDESTGGTGEKRGPLHPPAAHVPRVSR